MSSELNIFYLPPREMSLSRDDSDETSPDTDQPQHLSTTLARSRMIQVTCLETPPVHLPATIVLEFEWEPRTMEGHMVLRCSHSQVRNELFMLRDFGALLVTQNQSNDPNTFGPHHEIIVIFEHIILDRFFRVQPPNGQDEAINLNISGRVILG